jgi:parallel beta-helix repeat protein
MLGKAITLRSTNPNDPKIVAATIIDGENTRRGIACFNGETNKTIIVGFTITNGFGVAFDYDGDGDIDWWEDNGGGMINVNSNPKLENCTFENNSAYFGGGVFNQTSSPALTNCTFTNNNTTDYGGGGGGGMYNDYSSPTMMNCTFINNTANWGGGMGSENNSYPTLTGTIVCGNTQDQIFGCWDDGGGSCIAYSCEDNNGDGTPDKCTNPGGNTIHVPEDYETIQEAINVAVHDDKIIIGPGTYTGSGDCVINPMGKELWIRSSDGPEVTIIDGEGARGGIQCTAGETSETIFEGLTIKNCYGDHFGGMANYCSSPTINNCTFENNSGGTDSEGGGMSNWNSSPTLENCTFTNNTAHEVGGGMYNWNSNPTLTDCTFTGNTADYGGGMYNYDSNPELTDTIVCGNTPDQINGSWDDGGGVCVAYSCEDNNGDGIPDKCKNPGGNTILVPEEYATIQEAINVAVHGDEIIVMPGTYTSTQDGHVVNMLGKAITLRSTDPNDPKIVAATIIDGENERRGIACFSGETSTTTIAGFTITNGFAITDVYGYNRGGGMYNYESSPTLENCTFNNNSADDDGGGMYNLLSNPELTNCVFVDNTSGYNGSGMYNWNSDPTIENCTFENNSAYDGGGVYNDQSNPTLTYCTFENNSAYFGGGMFNYENSTPELTNCTFTNNTANYGGGVWNVESAPELTGCIFDNNTANSSGGGMGNENNSNPTLDNCTFENNYADDAYYSSGGGMYNQDSSPMLENCKFEYNHAIYDGGGMYNWNSSPTLTNTTVCANTPNQIYPDDSWVDNGGNWVEEECPVDCPTDINGDGVVGVNDLLAVIDQWGLTDSPADVNGDGIVDVSDLLEVVGNWGPCE